MLLLIFVILLAVGLAVIIFTDCGIHHEVLNNIFGIVPCFIGFFGLFITISILIANHCGVNGEIAHWETKREMLVWQLENDIYDNDNDLGKRDLMEDIVEYNTSLATKQANQNDFWIGILIPDIYDQFDFIELE